jgi:hypothetical protein
VIEFRLIKDIDEEGNEILSLHRLKIVENCYYIDEDPVILSGYTEDELIESLDGLLEALKSEIFPKDEFLINYKGE